MSRLLGLEEHKHYYPHHHNEANYTQTANVNLQDLIDALGDRQVTIVNVLPQPDGQQQSPYYNSSGEFDYSLYHAKQQAQESRDDRHSHRTVGHQ